MTNLNSFPELDEIINSPPCTSDTYSYNDAPGHYFWPLKPAHCAETKRAVSKVQTNLQAKVKAAADEFAKTNYSQAAAAYKGGAAPQIKTANDIAHSSSETDVWGTSSVHQAIADAITDLTNLGNAHGLMVQDGFSDVKRVTETYMMCPFLQGSCADLVVFYDAVEAVSPTRATCEASCKLKGEKLKVVTDEHTKMVNLIKDAIKALSDKDTAVATCKAQSKTREEDVNKGNQSLDSKPPVVGGPP